MNTVVSVAFRKPYVSHNERQFKYLQEFESNVILHGYINQLPYKDGIHLDNVVEQFQKSLYGFKPHAIARHAKSKVVWFDPSVLPQSSLDIIFNSLDEHPVLVRSGDNPLSKMCNQRAKDWFGVTDEDIKHERHVGGTIYAFNFSMPKAWEVFNLWKLAEENGIFGTQDDFMAGHWADEACMALSLFKCGVPRYFPDGFNYLNQKEL